MGLLSRAKRNFPKNDASGHLQKQNFHKKDLHNTTSGKWWFRPQP